MHPVNICRFIYSQLSIRQEVHAALSAFALLTALNARNERPIFAAVNVLCAFAASCIAWGRNPVQASSTAAQQRIDPPPRPLGNQFIVV